jgi:hypothetical protein
MDASAMFPRGFHPLLPYFLPDNPFQSAPRTPRSQVRVSYYFVDYGISSYFPPGHSRKLVTGGDGRDQEVPELSDTIPYDPFPVDVFIIGNMFRTELFMVRDFLPPACSRTQMASVFTHRNTATWSFSGPSSSLHTREIPQID